MRLEQIQRYFRYLRSYLKHTTPKKVFNAVRVELAYRFNNSNVDKLSPYFLFWDVATTCNLRCPLCQTGQRRNMDREQRMSLENYTKAIQPVKDFLFTVNLYNWAEPFLNREIYDIIEFNTKSNIGSYVSSNLNLNIDAERLVKSGLEHLIVSADGIQQEVYEKYRVGGRIDKVVENVKAIVAAKKKFKSKYPTIEWQCLVNQYNMDSMNETEKFAKEIGVNEVRFANLNLYSSTDPERDSKEWLPQSGPYSYFNEETVKHSGIRKPCFWLWRGAVVGADGAILPCCLYDIPGWGNAIDKDFLKQWRSGFFKKGRDLSNSKKADPGNCSVCDSCTAPFIFK